MRGTVAFTMPHRTPRSTRRRRTGQLGRPTKLTVPVQERIVADLRAGLYMETAAARAGVGISSLYRWLAQGQNEDAPAELREFWEAVTRARAEAEARMVATVQKAAMGGTEIRRTRRTLRDGTVEEDVSYAPPDGKVALDFLSRAFPARWAPRRAIDVELSGPDGGPVEFAPASPVSELATRLKQTIALAAADVEDITDDGLGEYGGSADVGT